MVRQMLVKRRPDQLCQDCAKTCLETVDYCLRQGGMYTSPRRMVLLLDCAEICAVTARFLSFDSQFTSSVLTLCTSICERTAQDCDQYGDAQMRLLAIAARRCADACREEASASYANAG